MTSKEHKFNSGSCKNELNNKSLDYENDMGTKIEVNSGGYKIHIRVSKLELEIVNKVFDKPPKVILSMLHEF